MAVLTVISEPLDAASGRCLSRELREYASRGLAKHVFDLRKLTEINSPTLSAIICALRVVREVGGSVSLVADQPNVLRILSASALDRIFQVYRTDSEALAALG